MMNFIAFEKFFTVNSPEVISDYTKLQQQKFVILYALFVEKYKEQQDKVGLIRIHNLLYRNKTSLSSFRSS